MGFCVQTIQGNGPAMDNTQELHLVNGWVWLVVRRDPDTEPGQWHIQGIGADERLAIEMCDDETYMIGPIPVNTSLPHRRVEWAGSYFPLRDK